MKAAWDNLDFKEVTELISISMIMERFPHRKRMVLHHEHGDLDSIVKWWVSKVVLSMRIAVNQSRPSRSLEHSRC
jgi:hypothetical protein